jgi:hypothetical protein
VLAQALSRYLAKYAYLLCGLWLGPGLWSLCYWLIPMVAAGSCHVVTSPCPCLSTNDELYAGWANSNMMWLVAAAQACWFGEIQKVLACGRILSTWLADFKYTWGLGPHDGLVS